MQKYRKYEVLGILLSPNDMDTWKLIGRAATKFEEVYERNMERIIGRWDEGVHNIIFNVKGIWYHARNGI